MIFFKQRKPLRKGGKKPEFQGEEGGAETYEEMMDGIARWNIENTDILEVLRGQIQEERLISWSKALNSGVRRVFKGPGYSSGSPEYESLRNLYQFIGKQRIQLQRNPTMRKAKGSEKMDPLSVCIISGIRALQREKRLPGMINTMKLKLLDRYVG